MQSNPLCSPRIHWVLNRGFDFKYCSDPWAIEMIIVKSPSMPLLGAGGGYWGIPLTGALQTQQRGILPSQREFMDNIDTLTGSEISDMLTIC